MKSIFLKYFFLFSIIMVTITANVNAESKYLYDVLKTEAESGGLAKEYTGEHHDSFIEEPSKKIYHWYTDDYYLEEQIGEKSNVIFGGFCWQIIRTTDTGGVKLLYNGIMDEGKCNNFGINQQIGTSAYNAKKDSPAYVGYMYNPNSIIDYKIEQFPASGIPYGTGITYSNGEYRLTNTSTYYDENHHYTCNNNTGVCNTVRYYYYYNNYIELSDGRNAEECLADLINADNINQTDSIIKSYIDNWYSSNLKDYTNKLEDTIFCNDRSISNIGGWNPNGGGTTHGFENALVFNGYYSNNLKCTNETDIFSINNKKAKLTFPIGLLTKQEASIIPINMRRTGYFYWLVTPGDFFGEIAAGYRVDDLGYINISHIAGTIYGVRPAISLKPLTKYSSGDGSKNNPYIIDLTNYYKIAIEEESKKGHIDFEIEDINSLPEGTEIRFKIVPNRGYMLKDLKIIDEENNNVNYTTNDNINFKFTMPDTDITIIPLYSLKETSDRITNPKTGNTKIILIAILFLIVSITYFIVRKKKKFSSI